MNRNRIRLSVFALVCLVACLPIASALAADSPLTTGGRLVIVGDSITEQKLYSRYMETYLTVCTPKLDLWILQLGWGGETAPGFLGRMDQDLLSFKPTVVTTCYGMNDGGYRPYEDSIGKRYGDAMDMLIQRAKAAGATVVVGSPGVVDTTTFRNRTAPAIYNDNLAHLRDIAKELAAKNAMPFANVHDAMISAMTAAKAKFGESYHVGGGDGVHPAPNGQLVMAYAFLKALGLDGQIGTITVDLAGQATATDGHKIVSAQNGKVEIESARYPFCFFGDDKKPDSTRSILPFVPFNQDLNRLTLVVRNLKAERAKVTWGQADKTFTRDQLEKGVNLAAEFLDNPFCEAFKKVDETVARKQGFETNMIKTLYRALGSFRAMNDPEIATATDMLQKRLVDRQAKLRQEVRDAVTPVKHALTVTPE
ncbi:MAG: GDSL-like Lipase/Acylhydrolase [Planctomycetes bacterium ADurb.Bin126]|nr:MAG: GDSL-like Lipase/Acylhydrolase [Planctomycetes bacterium ADurb.Bin126]HOD82561.1 SGNH/GDSL hydrolase family protein [Phycisphaerae bacterium]HQL74155.1 SGNH/GDSL hydrolase family protein [Phycisphaerae bacterium]